MEKSSVNKNRRVVYRKPGDIEVIQLVEETIPAPNPNEVLIRVEAAGVAFADIVMRNGLYHDQPNFPMTPGYDVCGEIISVGSKVSRKYQVGQRVVGLSIFGSYADFLCLEPSLLLPIPNTISPARVISLCLNYVSAWQMLTRFAGVEPGDTVLVHAAGGGVGTAFLQLAPFLDIQVIGTVSSSKMDIVDSLGGVAIDYQKNNFVKEVLKITKGKGVEAAFDAIGARNCVKTLKCIAPTGRLVHYGVTSGFKNGQKKNVDLALDYLFAQKPVLSYLLNNQSLLSYNIHELSKTRPHWYLEDLSKLVSLLEGGLINPIVADVYFLEEAKEAQKAFSESTKPGKYILINSW